MIWLWVVYGLGFIVSLFIIIKHYIEKESIIKVYGILEDWIYRDDNRRRQYTTDEMIRMSRQKWYGFRIPKESDFPPKEVKKSEID